METTNPFSLKLHDRTPGDLPLERLADYIKEFALIIGKENQPLLSSIDEGSVFIRVQVPSNKAPQVTKRLEAAHSGSTAHGLGKSLLRLEDMMAADRISKADFLGSRNEILGTLLAANAEEFCFSVSQEAEIDGEITGVIGADNTMHITIREIGGRIVKVVSGIEIGKELGHHIRSGYVRLHTYGQWNRTEAGWKPDPKKCHAEAFELLGQRGLMQIFDEINAIPGNAWKQVESPLDLWRQLRGIEA